MALMVERWSCVRTCLFRFDDHTYGQQERKVMEVTPIYMMGYEMNHTYGKDASRGNE